MNNKNLELCILGCIHTNNQQVSLDNFNSKFKCWIESMGWEFRGTMKPISDIVEEIENEALVALVEDRMINDDGTRYTFEEVKKHRNLKLDEDRIRELAKEIEFE